MLKIANPAVLVENAIKIQLVKEILGENNLYKIELTINKIIVVVIIIFECKVSFLNDFLSITSNITIKPNPPKKIIKQVENNNK